jgi:hypothetical protein
MSHCTVENVEAHNNVVNVRPQFFRPPKPIPHIPLPFKQVIADVLKVNREKASKSERAKKAK